LPGWEEWKRVDDLYLSKTNDETYEVRYNSSSQRYKTNIRPVIIDSAKVNLLEPKLYDVKDDETYEIYHLVLENKNDDANEGIWANGILSESLSMETYKRSRLLYNNTLNICKS
jgi:hypothetical protein